VNQTDPGGDAPDPPTLLELVRALIVDAQTLVEAETGYWRTAIGYALRRIKAIALLAVLALFFAFFMLMALVVGLLLALVPLVGTWGAMGLVCGALALATGWCVWRAVRHSKRMIRLLTQGDSGHTP
jgi:membrane protein implicated in regulation of membrane protease activity